MKKFKAYSASLLSVAVVVALVLLASTGCVRRLLEPSDYPPSLVEPAMVRTPSPIYRDGKDLITIKTVDGKPPTFFDDKVIVEPGLHRFQLRIELRHDGSTPDQTYITRSDSTLEVEVEAGQNYLIDVAEDESGLWIWAVDLADGIIVAGKPPRVIPRK